MVVNTFSIRIASLWPYKHSRSLHYLTCLQLPTGAAPVRKMTDTPPETAPDVPGEQPVPVSDNVETTAPAEDVVEEPAAEQEEAPEAEAAENAEPEPEVQEEPQAPQEEVNGQAPEDQSTKRKLEEDDDEAPEAKKMNTGMEGQPMDVEVRRLLPAVIRELRRARLRCAKSPGKHNSC